MIFLKYRLSSNAKGLIKRKTVRMVSKRCIPYQGGRDGVHQPCPGNVRIFKLGRIQEESEEATKQPSGESLSRWIGSVPRNSITAKLLEPRTRLRLYTTVSTLFRRSNRETSLVYCTRPLDSLSRGQGMESGGEEDGLVGVIETERNRSFNPPVGEFCSLRTFFKWKGEKKKKKKKNLREKGFLVLCKHSIGCYYTQTFYLYAIQVLLL